MIIKEANFIKSAADRKGWPCEESPEVAFVGRSNVGKSTLLNSLVGRRGLARVSGRPGRTQLLNFFQVVTDQGELMMVDLPGYGYAKVSRDMRSRFISMMNTFLRGRQTLRLVVLLVDSRRGAQPVDLDMVKVLRENAVPFIVVLTKSDKLPRTRLGGVVHSVAREMGIPQASILPFSVVRMQGREDLLETMAEACFESEQVEERGDHEQA